MELSMPRRCDFPLRPPRARRGRVHAPPPPPDRPSCRARAPETALRLPHAFFQRFHVPQRFYVKDLGVGIAEKLIVQRSYRLLSIILLNHEAHVDFRSALRNHAHIYVPDSLEYARGNAVLPTDILPHHADERLP